MTKKIEGYYHCHGCGNYFKASGGGAQQCPECNISQLSVSIWDEVIQKRDRNIAFETSTASAGTNLAHEKARRHADSKLDIVGKKRAKFKAAVILIGAVWLCFIGHRLYKIAKKQTAEGVESMVGDRTISSKDYQKMAKISKTCLANLKNFLKAPDDIQREKFIYQPKPLIIAQHYAKKPQVNLGIITDSKFNISEDRAEILFQTRSEKLVEAVFIRQPATKEGEEDQWLLDWKAFVNYSSMPFQQFIDEKPSEPHTFRLLITTKEYGLERSINFHGYRRHDTILNGLTGDTATVNITANHPEADKILKVIIASEYYAKYNKFLGEGESGCLGLNDPQGHIRVTVKLAYKNGALEIVDMISAHWMGDHTNELLRPEQQLLYDRKQK